MQGVTTAIVAFIFVCMAMPRLVKNRAQFYAAFVAALLIIGLDLLAHLFSGASVSANGVVESSGGLMKLAYVGSAFLQIVAFILLMLAVGGLSAGELAGELAGAYEVIRRGGEEKEIIIPLEEHMRERAAAAARAHVTPPPGEHQVIKLDEAGNEIPPGKDEGDKGIPLV
jgi:ABC-type amino acid transport system permease subunit